MPEFLRHILSTFLRIRAEKQKGCLMPSSKAAISPTKCEACIDFASFPSVFRLTLFKLTV